MITEYTQDLIDKLNTVEAFEGRVAATLAGTEADPALASMETPFAWVLFQSLQALGQPLAKGQMMQMNFSVVVFLPYGNGEIDFVETQLQILDDAAQAVRGTLAAEQGSYNWTFNGLSYAENNTDRVAYVLNFSAPAAYAK